MPPSTDDAAPPANNALLKSIQKGAKLKRAATNDRSAPIIDSKGASNASGTNDKQPSVDAVKQKLGGMFGGMPALGSVQLRPVNRGGAGREESGKPAAANPLPTLKPLPKPTPPVNRPVQSSEPPAQRLPVPAARPRLPKPVILETTDPDDPEERWAFELQLPKAKASTGRVFSYPSKSSASTSSPDKNAGKERKREIEGLREEMRRAASKEDFVLAQEIKRKIAELEGAQ